MNTQAYRLFVIAVILLVIGAVLPFLMVIRVLESTFFLNFLSYVASVAGLFLGFIGIAMYVGEARGKKKDDWHDY
jgi:hypothetical protein